MDENERTTKKRKIIVGFYVFMVAVVAVWWHERDMAREHPQDLRSDEESDNSEETSETISSHDGLNDDANSANGVQHGRSNASSSADLHSRKRKRSSDVLYTVLGRMADLLEKFLHYEPPKATAEMVRKEVSKVSYLDQTQVMRALDLMMHDQIKFEIYSELPDDLKKPWIMMHLNQ